jgi:hypothetical protein
VRIVEDKSADRALQVFKIGHTASSEVVRSLRNQILSELSGDYIRGQSNRSQTKDIPKLFSLLSRAQPGVVACCWESASCIVRAGQGLHSSITYGDHDNIRVGVRNRNNIRIDFLSEISYKSESLTENDTHFRANAGRGGSGWFPKLRRIRARLWETRSAFFAVCASWGLRGRIWRSIGMFPRFGSRSAVVAGRRHLVQAELA